MDDQYDLIHFDSSVPMRLTCQNIRQMDVHWNNELELIIVLNGSLTVSCNNRLITLNEDDVLAVNENILHGMYSEKGAVITDLTVDTGMVDGYDKRLRFDCNSAEDNDLGRYYQIKHLTANLIKMNSMKNSDTFFYNRAFIYMLLDELNRNFRAANADEYAPKYIKRLIGITTYIQEHYREIITLQRLADVANLSIPYLSSFFEKYLGTSFLTYYNTVRFNHAYNELMATENSIESIALNNGFSDARTFVNLFKKKYNTLPSEYRKQFSDGNENRVFFSALPDGKELGQENYLRILAKYLPEPGKSSTASIEGIANPKIIDIKDIDVTKPIKDLRHTWRCFTSVGRAKELLYKDVQDMLTELQREIPYTYIKFHGLLSDDMLVYREDEKGNPHYSFVLIDKVIDFLLSINLRPLIQLSFMPSALASDKNKAIFASPFNTSPPKDMEKWRTLIQLLMEHLVEQYGIDTLRQWLFCVWNEPETFTNLFGFEKASDFYVLYKITYDTVKGIDKELQFGSPSMFFYLTSRKWGEEFVKWCRNNDCLPDFMNLHYYDNDYTDEVLKKMRPPFFLTHNRLNTDENAFTKAIASMKENFADLGIGDLPVYLTEWNLTVSHRNLLNDTCFKSCYLVKNILENYDALDSFGYWLLTDFIEETQPAPECFHGGQGIFTYNGIKKPPFYAFSFINRLGDQLLAHGNCYFITRTARKIAIVLYNYEHFNHLFACGETFDMTFTERYTPFSQLGWLNIKLALTNIPAGFYTIREHTLGQNSGSAFDEWVKMGAKMIDWRDTAYLKNVSVPALHIREEQISGEGFAIDMILKPLEVRLIEIQMKSAQV